MLAVCSALVRFCSVSLRSLPTSVYEMLPPYSPLLVASWLVGNESGSNVVSLSDHVFHGLLLTAREHVNLAIRMLTE